MISSSATTANALAGAIRSAGKFPSGTIDCLGFDDGMVRLTFTFASGPLS